MNLTGDVELTEREALEMSATNSEMKEIKELLPRIINEVFPGTKFLTSFFYDQRKKRGPEVSVYLQRPDGRLLAQEMVFLKDPKYAYGMVYRVTDHFYCHLCTPNLILPISKRLFVCKGMNWIHSEGYPGRLLDDEDNKKELEFLADFFKVPLVYEEKYLRRKYGKPICIQCGNCCKHYRKVEITKEDKARWESQGRRDILRYVCRNNMNIKKCPFLRDNKCSIHDTKPEMCKGFPFHMSQLRHVRCGAIKGILEVEDRKSERLRKKYFEQKAKENLWVG